MCAARGRFSCRDFPTPKSARVYGAHRAAVRARRSRRGTCARTKNVREHCAATLNLRRRCHTRANGAIIRAARTNIVQTPRYALTNCLICCSDGLARTLQDLATPPASHTSRLDLGGELYPFPGGDMTPSDVLKLIKEKQAKFADLRFTDTRGKEQHVTIPARLVDENFFHDGKMFDGSSIAGWKGINESDMILMPDPTTAVIDPFFEETTVDVRCDVIEPTTMQGYERDPRSLAKRAEAYLRSTGIADSALFGPENEFFIFDSVRFGNEMQGCFYS